MADKTGTDQETGVLRNPDTCERSNLSFPVVGLGASAGGLIALKKFLEQTPKKTGLAFVVILHLSPKHESVADKVLQTSTRMPVVQVNKPTPLEPDHVYVISPNQDLTMSDGHLRVTEAHRPRGHHVAIDLFFRTLADTHQDKAVGIVLSGTGADGAVGIARIKEQGGVTFVQSPDDAEYDDMPRSAIANAHIDFVLPVADMPDKLIEWWKNAREIRLPEPADANAPILQTPPDESAAAEQALREILEILAVRSGHDFRYYKRATVLRRIERRMQVNVQPNLPAYRDFLKEHPEEARALLDDMLIGVTNFFRDRELRCAGTRGDAGNHARGPARRAGARVGAGLRHRRRSLFDRDAAGRPGPYPEHAAGFPGVRQRHRRSGDRVRPCRRVSGIHRDRRTTHPLAPVLRQGTAPLPHQQGHPRPRVVRAAQRAARSTVLAHRPDQLQESFDLP
jgi:hypothetical protein